MKDVGTGRSWPIILEVHIIKLFGNRFGLLGHLLFDHEPLDDHLWRYENPVS